MNVFTIVSVSIVFIFFIILLSVLFSVKYTYSVSHLPSLNYPIENFQNTDTPPSTTQESKTAEQLKAILKQSRPVGEDIAAFQGAYEQFLELHREFCVPWSKFIEVGRDYENQSSNETSNGGTAVGTGTTKEYVRLISLRSGKVFVDCSVDFPKKLDIGMNFQQMPYESQAYLDSLDFGITQLKKIQTDTQKALQGIPAIHSGGAPVNQEGFLDLTSQNCEEKDGVIRCVISIDTTNRNLDKRLYERLIELLEKSGKIREKLGEFKKELDTVQKLKGRAESGEIAQDVRITI
jgi:hypothetical protein